MYQCATGRTRWTTGGKPAAYSAFISGIFGGRSQIIGYDQTSLGGWDAKSGQRLWELVPLVGGDFNVPTPIAVDGKLLVTTENNGARLFQFDAAGRIRRIPVGRFEDLAPDTSTPVITNNRIFGAGDKLYCLDLQNYLRPIWELEEDELGDHAALFADDRRVLVVTMSGELILLDARAETDPIISRLRVFDADVDVYSHPALVGSRLYIRGGYRVLCLELGSDAKPAGNKSPQP